MKAYKFLLEGRVSPFSGVAWPEAGWVDAVGPVACGSAGVHACRPQDLPYWLADELWEIELFGEVVVSDLKIAAPRGRLSRRVAAWAEPLKREFSEYCARRTLEHAAAELRDAGLQDQGRALERAGSIQATVELWDRIAEAAGEAGALNALRLVEYAREATGACGYEPPAVIAYIAAHAADSRTGHPAPDPFVDERVQQARWLTERLRLT